MPDINIKQQLTESLQTIAQMHRIAERYEVSSTDERSELREYLGIEGTYTDRGIMAYLFDSEPLEVMITGQLNPADPDGPTWVPTGVRILLGFGGPNIWYLYQTGNSMAELHGYWDSEHVQELCSPALGIWAMKSEGFDIEPL